MYTINDLLKLDKVAIQCNSWNEADILLKTLESNDKIWTRAGSYNNLFNNYKTDTCYSIEKKSRYVSYCKGSYYKNNNYKIISFNEIDFNNNNTINNLTNKKEIMLRKVNFDLTPSIEGIIKDMTDTATGFSAYIVTQALRAEFPNHLINHAEVKELVHEIMGNNTSYSVTDNGRFIQYEYKNPSPVKSTATGNTLFKNVTPTVSKTSTVPTISSTGVSAHVDSSFIEGICYLEEKDILIIAMTSGTYAYEDVDISVYEDFKAAKSQGEYYNSNIKRHYESCKIKFN